MSEYDQLLAQWPPDEPFPAPASPTRAAEIPRTWGEFGIDTLVAFNRGARNVFSGLAGLPVDAINFVNQASPAHLTPASWGLRPGVLSQPGFVRDFQGYMRAQNQREHDQFLSPKAKQQEIEFNQTDGFWEAAGYVLGNPSFLGITAVEQVPQLAAAVPGRISATIALQSGLAGSMNANDTRADLAPRVDAGKMTQQEADQRASTVFTGTLALNAGTSLLPGAQTLERIAARVPAGLDAGQIATAVIGEAAQGGLTEAGEQLLQNLATDQAWDRDLGKVAALGSMLEGSLGGAGRGVEMLAASRHVETGTPKIAPILQSEGFRHWYGERSIEQLETAYAKRDDTDGGRRIDVDLVRELAPDYAADRTRASEVHEYASALSKELFARALARPVAPGREPVVAFLAGGGGSGKSTAAGATIDGINPDIIVDGTLANVNRAQREIEASLANDREVHVIYVYRSPEKSVEGAINRAISEGRPVPVDALAEAHANAGKTVKTLAQLYNGNADVKFEAIWNDGELAERRSIPIEEIPDVNKEQAEQTFRSAVESANAAGHLSRGLYEAFRGGETPTTTSRKTQDGEMDHETGGNRRPGEEISKSHRNTEQTDARNPTQDPVASEKNAHIEEIPDVNQQHAESVFRNAVESANAAGHLSRGLYEAFRGGETPTTTSRKTQDGEMDHETGGNRRPGEEISEFHRNNEETRPEQHAQDAIASEKDAHLEGIIDVNREQAEQTFRNAVESANAAGNLSRRLYEAFRGGKTTDADRRRAPDREMDHETGGNRRPGEEISEFHRNNEETRPEQHAQDPIAFDNKATQIEEAPEANPAPTSTPISFSKDNAITGPDAHTGKPSGPKTTPVQGAALAITPIQTAHATAPSVTAPTAAAAPQPGQAVDPQQQRQAMADAFRKNPGQALEQFPELAPAHDAFHAVATRAETMKNTRHRERLLSSFQNYLGKRIERDQRIPSPQQSIQMARNEVNRMRGHAIA